MLLGVLTRPVPKFAKNNFLAGLDAEPQRSDPEFGLEIFPHVRYPPEQLWKLYL